MKYLAQVGEFTSSMPLLYDILDKTAQRSPSKVAIMTDVGHLTYGQLAQQSRHLAAFLHKDGVRRGDRVAVILPSSTHVAIAIFAASRLGAMFIVQSEHAKAHQLNHMLRDAGPAVIITSEALLERMELQCARMVLTIERDWNVAVCGPDRVDSMELVSNDPVSLTYTSGSTSKPKGVISTHGNVLFATHAILDRLKYNESDTVANFLPLSFDYGLYQMFLSFRTGATLALGSYEDVGPGLLTKLNQWQATVLPLVPHMASILIKLLRRSRTNLPHLRMITNTGASLPSAFIDELTTVLPRCSVYAMFGLTECKRVSILAPEDYERKPNSVGKPLRDTECLIVDKNGQICPPGQVGELVVRGLHVMSGYWRDPELTDKRFRPWGPGLERALFTGDMCSIDTDGFLYFHGRDDDIYKHHGFRVSTLEVEAAALDIPEVDEAVALQPQRGYGPVLFVVTNLSDHEVLSELRQRLEDFKLPELVCRVTSMPLNVNGKINRRALRNQLSLERQ